jgi:hypothetical protein
MWGGAKTLPHYYFYTQKTFHIRRKTIHNRRNRRWGLFPTSFSLEHMSFFFIFAPSAFKQIL